jgi:hypothetical protein
MDVGPPADVFGSSSGGIVALDLLRRHSGSADTELTLRNSRAC